MTTGRVRGQKAPSRPARPKWRAVQESLASSSSGMEEATFAKDRSGKRRLETAPTIEPGLRADEDVGGGPCVAQRFVGETARPARGRRVVADDEQQVVVAVGTGVAACS